MNCHELEAFDFIYAIRYLWEELLDKISGKEKSFLFFLISVDELTDNNHERAFLESKKSCSLARQFDLLASKLDRSNLQTKESKDN